MPWWLRPLGAACSVAPMVTLYQEFMVGENGVFKVLVMLVLGYTLGLPLLLFPLLPGLWLAGSRMGALISSVVMLMVSQWAAEFVGFAGRVGLINLLPMVLLVWQGFLEDARLQLSVKRSEGHDEEPPHQST